MSYLRFVNWIIICSKITLMLNIFYLIHCINMKGAYLQKTTSLKIWSQNWDIAFTNLFLELTTENTLTFCIVPK